MWLSIHCYILRATEQAVNCSVWDPMKDIVSGTKVVLEKKDIETSGEDAQNAAVEETEAAESIAETDSQKQQKETAVETAEIADSAKQIVDKAVKTEKKTIK